MILKEKNAEKVMKKKSAASSFANSGKNFAVSPAAGMLLCAAAGALLGGAFGGGAGISLSVPLISVLPPFYGLCVFIGSAASYIARGAAANFLTELAAMPAMLGARLFFYKHPSPKAAAIISGAVYIIAGTAASFASKITGILIAAIFFRSVICAVISYFAAELRDEICSDGKISVTGEKALGTAVIYVLLISSLCVIRLGSFCPARTAGIFVILAAGGRFGGGGAAAAGALFALGTILGETKGGDMSEMVRGSALMSCSGIAACIFPKKSRLAAAVSFSVSMLILTLFMGKISYAEALMTDALAASALYCLIPDRLYMRALNSAVKNSSAAECFSGSLSMAADTVKSIGESVDKAAVMLADINGGNEYDPASEICGSVCKECRSNTFCCKGDIYRGKYIIPEALRIFENKGSITEKELPKALEGCSKKAEMAEAVNRSGRAAALEQRKNSFANILRENMTEQLFTVSDILSDMSEEFGGERIFDANVSEKVRAVVESAGASSPSASVFYDAEGHIFISCFFRSGFGVPLEALTEKLSALTDRELEMPEAFTENKTTRLRWHEPASFVYESGKAVKCGRGSVSGDCDTEFTDGFGNVYFIISDGMGSGGRAALESNMTVSLLSRLIRSGTGAAAAVRLVNLILLSKSSDEVFATVDLLRINLFTGRADMIKSGAAQTFFKSGGAVKAVESRTLPAGIMTPAQLEKRTVRLSGGDCAVMLSDGIRPGTFPRVRELILSDGYSPKACADEIISYDSSEENFPCDDRTVIVVKLHKI